MTILKNTGRPVGSKAPSLLLDQLEEKQEQLPQEISKNPYSADQDEQLNFTGLIPKMGGRTCEWLETVAREVKWGTEKEDRYAGDNKGHRA